MKLASYRVTFASMAGLFASPWIPTLVPWYPRLQIISAQIECLPDTTHKESGLPLSHAMSDEFM